MTDEAKPVVRRSRRNQRGHIYESSGSFWVRYYMRDSENKPVQKSKFLCKKDDGRHSKRGSKAVKDLCDGFMRTINAAKPGAAQRTLITDYWTDVYLPYITENLVLETVMGYKSYWKKELEPHFRGRYLQEYGKHDRNSFLLALANSGKYSKQTVKHIKNCASGLFTHAIDFGDLLQFNPWHVGRRELEKLLKNMPEAKEADLYTLEEMRDAIGALKARLDCQTILALAFFAGLRREEINGLKWEDLRDGRIYVTRRWRPSSGEGALKSKKSKRSVPVIKALGTLLNTWNEKCGKPESGWVFPNPDGSQPITIQNYLNQYIKPALGAKYKGLHAGRHGLRLQRPHAFHLQFASVIHQWANTGSQHFLPRSFSALHYSPPMRTMKGVQARRSSTPIDVLDPFQLALPVE